MRTIESPGVEINEKDLTFNTNLPVGTTIYAVGYANQGPTDELVNITSVSNFEEVFGAPTNAAERYLYQTCFEVLQANGNLLVTRLPYGSGAGDGYVNNYSVLAYPFFAYSQDNTVFSGVATTSTNQVITSTIASISGSSTIEVTNNFFNALSTTNYIGLVPSAMKVTFNGYVKSGSVTSAFVDFVPSTTAGVLSANVAGYTGTYTVTDKDTYDFVLSATKTFSSGAVSATCIYQTATGANVCQLSKADNYYIGQPYHITIDESTYQSWQQGGISWNDILGNPTTSSFDASSVGNAGMVVVNEIKSSIDDAFAGYYLGVIDNTKIDKGSNFDSLLYVKSVNNQTLGTSEWVTLDDSRLSFALSGRALESAGSISEIAQSVPTFDFSGTGAHGFSDSVIISLFKIRPSIYNQNTRVLDRSLAEAYVGSFDSTRTIPGQNGQSQPFFIGDVVNNNSKVMQVFVNPSVSNGTWWDAQTGNPVKTVRTQCDASVNEGTTSSDIISVNPAQPNGRAAIAYTLASAGNYMGLVDGLYGLGEYVKCNTAALKYIGNLPLKLERALRLGENREQIRIDVVPEVGLGTVWTGMNLDMSNWPTNATDNVNFTQTSQVFDDNVFINGILNAHTFDADSDGLLDQTNGTSSVAYSLYNTVYNIFLNFTSSIRKDCLYIADPLRYIFVQGNGTFKVMDNKSLNFSQHIYWPLKNLFGAGNSSYACTYANWFKNNDAYANKLVWSPNSGWMARLMVETDTKFFPWMAPAGLTRGVLHDLVDIGVNPTTKQRDLLYKIGINPVVYWPQDGYVSWGQKTLQSKPTAFDRINVRRLFLWLEKGTLQITRYFVFENNTPSTRSRMVAALKPIFDFAKANEGIYDYMIVCDKRNNTSDVIDRNEMVVDIYIKPVRVAEYILVNFVATRTSQNFNELV